MFETAREVGGHEFFGAINERGDFFIFQFAEDFEGADFAFEGRQALQGQGDGFAQSVFFELFVRLVWTRWVEVFGEGNEGFVGAENVRESC